eukprot:363137-Chlamydomonas_euryale.AAC.4
MGWGVTPAWPRGWPSADARPRDAPRAATDVARQKNCVSESAHGRWGQSPPLPLPPPPPPPCSVPS